MGALSPLAADVLACDEQDYERLESLVVSWKAGLSVALGAAETAEGAQGALSELLALCQGEQADAFLERLGWETVAALSGSHAATSDLENAELVRRIVLHVAASASAREVFSSFLASLSQALASLSPHEEAGEEGHAHAQGQRGRAGAPGSEAPGPSPPGVQAQVVGRVMLVGSLVQGILAGFRRLPRRHRLFFVDAAGILFSRVPDRLSRVYLQAGTPGTAFNDSLRLCLRAVGHAAPPSPTPPSASPSPAPGAAHSHVGPHCCSSAAPSTSMHQEPDCATPEAAPAAAQAPGSQPCVPGTSLGPSSSSSSSSTSSNRAQVEATAGRLQQEIQGALRAVIDLAVHASEVCGVGGAQSLDDDRELLVFRRLVGQALLHTAALSTPALGSALHCLEDSAWAAALPASPATVTGHTCPRGAAGAAFPLACFLQALQGLGLAPAVLAGDQWWTDAAGEEACAALAGKEGEACEEDLDESEEQGPESKQAARHLCERGAVASLLGFLLQRGAGPATAPVGSEQVLAGGGGAHAWTGSALEGLSWEQLVLLLRLSSAQLEPSIAQGRLQGMGGELERTELDMQSVIALQMMLLLLHSCPSPAAAAHGTGDARGRACTEAEVMPLLERVVERLRTPPAPSMPLIQRASHAVLVLLLRKLLSGTVRLEAVHSMVKAYAEEPMLVSLLCSLCKEELMRSPADPIEAAPVKLLVLGVLDTVLSPGQWPQAQHSFPSNADAVIGGLNLLRFLLLRDLRLREDMAASGAAAEAVREACVCLDAERLRRVRDLWLTPVYQLARRLEAELQDRNREGLDESSQVLLLPVGVVLGVASRCLELVG